MKHFSIRTNPLFIFGEKKGEILPELLKARKVEHIILVTGTSSFTDSGNGERVERMLNGAGIAWDRETVKGEPSPELVDGITHRHKNMNIDAIVAIGGGSVIDTGKAVSAMLPIQGRVTDYLDGVGTKTPPGEKQFFIALPTTAGTGSEATKNAVISGHRHRHRSGNGGFKKSLRHDNYVPDIAIVDPLLTMSVPKDVTAYSGLDAVTQLLEAYVSSRSNPYTDSLIMEALIGAGQSLERAVGNGNKDRDARAKMSYAAYVSGVALANAGLGVVHGIAGPLGGLFPVPHGVVCGCLLGKATKVIIEKLFDAEEGENKALLKYAEAGKYLTGEDKGGVEENCNSLVEILNRWITQFEVPRLSSFGITEEDLPGIVEKCGVKNTPVRLEQDDIREILSDRL